MSDTRSECKFRDVDIVGRRYRLGIQEQGASSPDGRTVAVFRLQKEGPPLLVEQRLRAGWESDDDLWRWAEGVARAHAVGSL